MPQSFDSHNPPFDRLTHDEINELRAALDIGYFRPGEVIVERNSGSEHLHVIIKGSVEERDDDVVEAVLRPERQLRRPRGGARRRRGALHRGRGDALLSRAASRPSSL